MRLPFPCSTCLALATTASPPRAAFMTLQDDTDWYGLRFEGVGRLYGPQSLERLAASRVCVIGLGGVGSWAVEALARSGVGSLTLVDPDEVCISNTNRQLNALHGTVGRSKASVLAERVRQINPECRVRERQEWLTLEGAHELVASEAAEAAAEGDGAGFAVLDAIDGYVEKCAAVEACVRLGLHVAVAGAAGGRSDPSCVRVADLTTTSRDPLLAAVRRSLRAEHAFPSGVRYKGAEAEWGVPAIYSIEKTEVVAATAADKGANGWRDCDARFGTAGFVTGTFGLTAASVITRLLATGAPLPESRAHVLASLPEHSSARPVAQRIAERKAQRSTTPPAPAELSPSPPPPPPPPHATN